MKTTVVVLNWNRPHETIRAVNSVLSQECGDFEIIIWDNASTDQSHRILQSQFHNESKVRIIVADKNYGVAQGRNRAFRYAAGELIVSLDSDAYFTDNRALQKIESFTDKDTSIGAVSFEVVRPDGHLMWPFERPAEQWRKKSFETIRIDGCAFATRRNVFQSVGGFAAHFSPYGAEDQHFALKLIRAGYKVYYYPEVSVIHAFSEHGRSARQLRGHVRNLLWIRMEMIPFPFVILSTARLITLLLRDGVEEKRLPEYIKGIAEAFLLYRPRRRAPLPRDMWLKFRSLVAEDRSFSRYSIQRQNGSGSPV